MTNNRTFKNTDLETMRALTQCRKPDWTCLSSTNFHWISVHMAGLTCYGCSPCRWLAIVVNGWPWRKAMLHLLLELLSLFPAIAELWKNCVSNLFQRLSGLSPPPLTSLFSWVTTHSAGHSGQQSQPVQHFPKCTVISVLCLVDSYIFQGQCFLWSLLRSRLFIYSLTHQESPGPEVGSVVSPWLPHTTYRWSPPTLLKVWLWISGHLVYLFFQPLPTSS